MRLFLLKLVEFHSPQGTCSFDHYKKTFWKNEWDRGESIYYNIFSQKQKKKRETKTNCV